MFPNKSASFPTRQRQQKTQTPTSPPLPPLPPHLLLPPNALLTSSSSAATDRPPSPKTPPRLPRGASSSSGTRGTSSAPSSPWWQSLPPLADAAGVKHTTDRLSPVASHIIPMSSPLYSRAKYSERTTLHSTFSETESLQRGGREADTLMITDYPPPPPPPPPSQPQQQHQCQHHQSSGRPLSTNPRIPIMSTVLSSSSGGPQSPSNDCEMTCVSPPPPPLIRSSTLPEYSARSSGGERGGERRENSQAWRYRLRPKNKVGHLQRDDEDDEEEDEEEDPLMRQEREQQRRWEESRRSGRRKKLIFEESAHLESSDMETNNRKETMFVGHQSHSQHHSISPLHQPSHSRSSLSRLNLGLRLQAADRQSLSPNFPSIEFSHNCVKFDVTPTVNNQKQGGPVDFDQPPKPCNCKKSKCLKLYCECFARGETCRDCNCVGCHNTEKYSQTRKRAIQIILERDPNAFQPKVAQNSTKHLVGCRCKKSGCSKKYCECYQAGVKCSEMCKCLDCKNHSHVNIRRVPKMKMRRSSSLPPSSCPSRTSPSKQSSDSSASSVSPISSHKEEEEAKLGASNDANQTVSIPKETSQQKQKQQKLSLFRSTSEQRPSSSSPSSSPSASAASTTTAPNNNSQRVVYSLLSTKMPQIHSKVITRSVSSGHSVKPSSTSRSRGRSVFGYPNEEEEDDDDDEIPPAPPAEK